MTQYVLTESVLATIFPGLSVYLFAESWNR